MTSTNIILVGFSGTGKSRVGREAARLLDWECVDCDEEVRRRAGKPIPGIFVEDGEPAFRRMEKEILAEACSGEKRVIATGGGAMIDQDNRWLMLSRGYVVCLEADAGTIHGRLMASSTGPVEERPLLSGPDPLERIAALKAERQPYYAMAHCVLPTDGLTVEEVAGRVVEKAHRSEKEVRDER